MNSSLQVIVMILITGLLTFSLCMAYDGTDLSIEQSSLMTFQNRIIKDTLCSYINMKKAQPVLPVQDNTTFSVDLSYGDAVAPLFFYNADPSMYPLFGPLENIYGSGEDFPAINMAMAGAFPADILGTVDISYLPLLKYEGAEMENFKIGSSIYYHVLKDALFLTGLYAGIGYTYTSGSINRNLDVSASIGGDPVKFDGNFNSDWNYNSINLEIFVNNQLFILNFYGRADYYLLFGRVRTQFTGRSSVAENAGNSLSDNSTVYGFVVSLGMEIAFGWVKLNIEAGKDLLSQGMYINAGTRFGF